MRVGFVLRSAEIKPLFYDLFIESTIYFFWYRATSTRHACLSALPNSPPHVFTHVTTHTVTLVRASVCGCRCVCAKYARAPPHARPSKEAPSSLQPKSHTYKRDGLIDSGSTPELVTSTATLRRQHRIPSDLRS